MPRKLFSPEAWRPRATCLTASILRLSFASNDGLCSNEGKGCREPCFKLLVPKEEPTPVTHRIEGGPKERQTGVLGGEGRGRRAFSEPGLGRGRRGHPGTHTRTHAQVRTREWPSGKATRCPHRSLRHANRSGTGARTYRQDALGQEPHCHSSQQ